jgi:tRNA(Arg) A34 adenosine deaminase TadA
MTKLIVDCETGETVERELNKVEKDQQKIDEAEFLAIQAEKAEKEAERLALAERLGLTADELKLLLG